MERGKVSKVENALLIAAVGIAAVSLVFVIYTIQFLSHNLLDALAPSGQGAPAASFNIAGAQALGL